MKAIQELIDAIEKQGCNCDLMHGYGCPIHAKIRELKARIKELCGEAEAMLQETLAGGSATD